MATFTVIGFTKDGFDRFTNVTQADNAQEAAQKALKDEFIKREHRRAPQTEYLGQLENETGFFIAGVVEGEHDNLNDELERYS